MVQCALVFARPGLVDMMLVSVGEAASRELLLDAELASV